MLYRLVCEDCKVVDGKGVIVEKVPVGEASSAMQAHITNKKHKNLSMESMDMRDGHEAHVKISRKDGGSPPQAAPAERPPAITMSYRSESPPKPAGASFSSTPATTKAPSPAAASQKSNKKVCRHIGTPFNKEGLVWRNGRRVQRYRCHACGGTFTEPQQVLTVMT